MFTPIRCPNSDCPRHRDAGERFFWRNGRYRAKCRSHWVACFKCKTCRTSFSRQTFRQDYRDRVPSVNATILTLLCSGIGLRQIARVVGVHRNTVTRKFRKIGRQMGFLNANLRKKVDRDLVTLLMDEFESYEGRRNTRPVTIPMVIEKESDFIVDCVSAPIRPRGTMTEKRKRAIAREERRFGARKDRSKPALERVLKTAASLFGDITHVEMRSDEKTTYPGLIRAAFADKSVTHSQTNSKLVRDTFNPLFPINHAEGDVARPERAAPAGVVARQQEIRAAESAAGALHGAQELRAPAVQHRPKDPCAIPRGARTSRITDPASRLATGLGPG